jgi:hypothetical protein
LGDYCIYIAYDLLLLLLHGWCLPALLERYDIKILCAGSMLIMTHQYDIFLEDKFETKAFVFG